MNGRSSDGLERRWASFFASLNGRSSDGPERRWASFLASLNGRSSDGPERRWASFLASLPQCAVWLVSMLAYVLVSILRMFVLLPCRAGVSPMSVHVDFSFPCRNCFPKESGVFWST